MKISLVKVTVLYTYVTNQHMHIYKYYVLLHVIILHQHVSVTLVTIVRVSYKNNANSIKIIVQKYMTKPFAITFDIFKRILWS